MLDSIGLGAGEGGLCYERGPHGFTCHWGRVVQWEPGERIAFTWQIGAGREPVPDPAKASEVEVRFRAVDGGSALELEHGGFERHDGDAAAYREALASNQGWPKIIDRYIAAASERI